MLGRRHRIGIRILSRIRNRILEPLGGHSVGASSSVMLVFILPSSIFLRTVQDLEASRHAASCVPSGFRSRSPVRLRAYSCEYASLIHGQVYDSLPHANRRTALAAKALFVLGVGVAATAFTALAIPKHDG